MNEPIQVASTCKFTSTCLCVHPYILWAFPFCMHVPPLLHNRLTYSNWHSSESACFFTSPSGSVSPKRSNILTWRLYYMAHQISTDLGIDEDLGEEVIREMMWNEILHYYPQASTLPLSSDLRPSLPRVTNRDLLLLMFDSHCLLNIDYI